MYDDIIKYNLFLICRVVKFYRLYPINIKLINPPPQKIKQLVLRTL